MGNWSGLMEVNLVREVLCQDILMEKTHEDLFAQYLEVCNQALQASKYKFPFQQILGAAQRVNHSRKLEVFVIEDRPQSAYVLSLKNEKMMAESKAPCVDCDCQGEWRVARSYLEDVIQNSPEYIQNPAKIDWGWLFEQD